MHLCARAHVRMCVHVCVDACANMYSLSFLCVPVCTDVSQWDTHVHGHDHVSLPIYAQVYVWVSMCCGVRGGGGVVMYWCGCKWHTSRPNTCSSFESRRRSSFLTKRITIDFCLASLFQRSRRNVKDHRNSARRCPWSRQITSCEHWVSAVWKIEGERPDYSLGSLSVITYRKVHGDKFLISSQIRLLVYGLWLECSVLRLE